MKLALPKFQFRFVPGFGNVIHPGNFHPVGTQQAARAMVERVETGGTPMSISGQSWLVVGGSGGFGSAARAVLGAARGANTLNVSFDAQPNPESNNKVRKIGSPGFHRNLAVERSLRALGTTARTVGGDAFDPELRESAIDAIREHFGGKIDGLVWSLAAPRALDPRTGALVASALKPLGQSVSVKTFTGRDERSGQGSEVAEIELPPGTPEEAVRTIYVMGGGIVSRWVGAMLAADVLADGFKLLTISYRGNPLNEGVYRKGLIGLAKADLEFETKALDHVLAQRVGGNAYCVEGPAVVTEASGGIPGVPFYMAHLLDVMGDAFEDPLASMLRMFEQHFGSAGPSLDDEGLLRMDDRELAAEVQQSLSERFDAARPGDAFPGPLYERFMSSYAQTRGFDVEGVDYEAQFDTDEVCQP
jgi:enoyl-[acyl-carrier protein] reductase / trans-2-enoyl-CoA reductase (NAD+)